MEADDNRRAPRRRALKGAQIAFIDGASVIDCTVRDISATGARLKVVSPVGIPERFTLVIAADAAKHDCRVVWRRANEIGVAFNNQ